MSLVTWSSGKGNQSSFSEGHARTIRLYGCSSYLGEPSGDALRV
jgi:hypothetical protein